MDPAISALAYNGVTSWCLGYPDQAQEYMQRALDSLPQDYRMAVILADLENFSYKEIAEILEMPVGTVMSRLYRGRKMMESGMLDYAREHGYLRSGDPTKMRSRPGKPSAG